MNIMHIHIAKILGIASKAVFHKQFSFLAAHGEGHQSDSESKTRHCQYPRGDLITVVDGDLGWMRLDDRSSSARTAAFNKSKQLL